MRRGMFATILISVAIGLSAAPSSLQDAPTALITGAVLNENREPMAGVRVETWMRRIDGGLQLMGDAPTNSLGVYRLRVPPGDHYVVARVWHYTLQQGPPNPPPSPCSPPPPPPPIGLDPQLLKRATPAPAPPRRPEGEWFSELPRWIPQPRPDEQGRPRTIATTFHPGTSGIDSATVVRVAAGQELTGIDLQLTPVEATTVRGHIVSPPGRDITNGSEVRLRLPTSPSERDDVHEHKTWVKPGNTFRFVDVPAGLYVLEVQLQERIACDVIGHSIEDPLTQIRLDVPAGGLENLEIELAKSMLARGEIVFEGASARPGPGLMDIWFAPVRGGRFVPAGWESKEFSSGHLPAGGYAFRVAPNGKSPWVVKSMTLGALDLTMRPLDVVDAGIAGIHVVMTDRPSPLDGRIVNLPNVEVPGFTVVVFPVDRASWGTAHDELMRFEKDRSRTGTFRFAHLPAGDYFVAAIDEQRFERWPQRALLEELARQAETVRMSPGQAQTITLTIR
jgi:hypothetical protein